MNEVESNFTFISHALFLTQFYVTSSPNSKVFIICLPHWMTIPKFWPKPIPRFFFRYQIFRNQNQNFFSKTKFSETETDTFYPRQNSPKPKPILFSETKFSETKTETFFRDQILRNRYQNPPKIGKSLKTETETETFQYPCKFLELSSIFLLFLL